MIDASPLPLLESCKPKRQKYSQIIKEEVHLNLIQPLKYIMNLDNFSDDPDPTNRPFCVNQQMQVYLHTLSSKESQHTNGNIFFALYADFIKQQYDFNINDLEIQFLSFSLGNNNITSDKASDIITRRSALNCIEKSIENLGLNKINTENFHLAITKHLNTINPNLYMLTRESFISQTIKTLKINNGSGSEINLARKFITNLKQAFKQNKISITAIKRKKKEPEPSTS